MKKSDYKTPHREQDLSSLPFYDINATISATECTGIAPTGVCCPHEAEAIGELYDIHTPRPSRNFRKHQKPAVALTALAMIWIFLQMNNLFFVFLSFRKTESLPRGICPGVILKENSFQQFNAADSMGNIRCCVRPAPHALTSLYNEGRAGLRVRIPEKRKYCDS